MPLTPCSPQPRHQNADIISEAPGLCRREFASDGRLGQSGQVITHHITLYAPKSGDHSVYLMRDLDAVALVLDHLLQPAHLALNALQARQLLCVIGWRDLASVSGIILHGCCLLADKGG